MDRTEWKLGYSHKEWKGAFYPVDSERDAALIAVGSSGLRRSATLFIA